MIKKSSNISIRDLRSCYSKYGILSGRKHFDDYWARDSFFSSLGIIKLKNYNIVKKNLKLFLRYMKKEGQLPLRIDNYFLYFLKFLNIKIKTKYKARYKEDKLSHVPKDQNSLFIIALNEYIKTTKDNKFFKKNYDKIKRIMDWNGTDLIKEKSYAGWADSIKKRGYVLYTNVLHCKALYDFYKLSGDRNYLELHKKIKDKINKKFWNGKYYIDFIYDKKYDYLSVDGNVLGILFDVFPKNRLKIIINSIERKRKNDFISLAYPQYKKNLIFFPFIFLNMYDYHSMIWLWLDSLYALALYKNNYKKQSKELINKISDLIVKYNNVYEVYERQHKDYQPVNRFFYKAEVPFAWSSGLFIYAVKEMKFI